MKIDYVMMSTDDNPLYYDFWPAVSKYWKVKYNIHPVLVFCGKKVDLDETYGDVYYVDEVPGVTKQFSSTWARFWITSKYLNSVCIISDIDIIPITSFFQKKVINIDNNAYVHLNYNIYNKKGMNLFTPGTTVPICYQVATGETFNRVFNFGSWEEENKKVFNTHFDKYGTSNEAHLRGAEKLCLDELYSTKKILEHYLSGHTVIFKGHDQVRLDRSKWNYEDLDIINGKYDDCHFLRPYSKFKDKIDRVFDLAYASVK